MDELRASMAAHKAGRFDEAEAGYRRVLEANPYDPKALYYLGLLRFHRGDIEAAVLFVRRCLDRAPSNGIAWNTLGNMLSAARRKSEALSAYRRATVATPSMGEAWYNLGVCCAEEGDTEGAIQHFCAGITHQPDYAKCHEALATLLYRLGRLQEAASVYRDWAARDPRNPVAAHMAAAALQTDIPRRASDDYVRSLFDQSAGSFDADLQRLGYRAPQRVASELIERTSGQPVQALLDAGCGTGLCGPLLRKACARLVGVDLSPGMLERARLRACYDELFVSELTAFMRSHPRSFDAVVSADTLVYFGSLEEPLSAMRESLRLPGTVAFTLELLPDEVVADYRLEVHGRYAHSEDYIRRAVASAGLQLQMFSREILREEREVPVQGGLICAGAQ